MTSLEAMDQDEKETEKVVDKLTKTKPNEWPSVLDGLFEGVSFRPVQGSVEPFTVTSLLAKISDEGASEPRKDTATGRRRRHVEKKDPTEKPQEDDRPLEDLLRDLGEIADGPGPKQKKKGAKKAVPVKQETPIAAEVAEVATAAKRRARVTEVPQADPQTEEEVTPVASEEITLLAEDAAAVEEDGWQRVPTKQARRAAHKAAKEEREQRAADAREAAADAVATTQREAAATATETASKESESCTSERGAPMADAETTEAPSSVRSKQAADAEEPSVEAAEPLDAEEPSVEAPQDEQDEQVQSSAPARRRSRSEGPQPLDKEVEQREVPEVSQAASPSGGMKPTILGWQVQPSVGTWLMPADGVRQGSPVGQLWPATPESTPPTSPRRMSGNVAEVVWMPIPVHLAGEVQQLINARLVQMTSSCW